MSTEYVSKVNNKPIAASEAAPSSSLATTIAGKQDSLGINPTSGDTKKVLNERGQFAMPPIAGQAENARHVNIENYLQIEIKHGQNQRHASITIFGDNGTQPFIANIGFQFLSAPGSGESAGFQQAPVLSMVECNNLSSNAYVPNVWYINNGSSGSGYIYCKWSSNKRLTVLLNTYAPGYIELSDVSSLPSGAVAASNGHSLPHVSGINSQVGSPTVPVYVSAAGELVPATGVAPGHVAYERTNEINYANVPTSGNKNRHWLNYRNGDTGQPDPNNLLTDYFFGNRNYTTAGVYLNAEGFSPTVITGVSGTSGKNYVPFAKFTLTNTGTSRAFVAFRCVVMRANNDDYIGQVDILVKIRQNSWHAVAMKCVRGGNDSIDEYGNFCDGVFWESGQTIYIGVRTRSFSSKVSVLVQNMPLNSQNAPLEGTATFTLGDYTSEVASLTEQDMHTRDLVLARALYGTSGERMTFAYDPSGLGSGSPVADAEAYWAALAQKSVQVVYNNRGNEYSLLFSKSELYNSHNYGSVLRWGYTAPYMEMLRVHQDNWMSSDWETMCQPSVLCFEYTTDNSKMAALVTALNDALSSRKVGTSATYDNRKPIVFLHKSGEYYMLTYTGGGGGSGGGTRTWWFQHSPYNKEDTTTNGYSLHHTWTSGGTNTYSWSSIASTAFSADLYLKTGSDTYYAGSGNATIDITDTNTLYYTIMMNGSAVFTLDTASESTVHTLLMCKRRTTDPCATVTIQWRSMTGALQEMIVRDDWSTLTNNHEIIFDVWIKKVTTPGGGTYAIATVTPQAPRFVSLLEEKSNWGNGMYDTDENGVFGMKPYYTA